MFESREINDRKILQDASGLIKFAVPEGDGFRRHLYSNTWAIESYPELDRLIVAPEKDHVPILLDLAKAWSGLNYLLYVLVRPRRANRMPGRYQSRPILELTDVQKFCSDNRRFLESDGRHILWIGSVSSSARVVYDNHNVLYAYGDLSAYAAVLSARGLVEGPCSIPEVHVHNYHPANDYYEDKVMGRQWAHCPLDPKDDR